MRPTVRRDPAVGRRIQSAALLSAAASVLAVGGLIAWSLLGREDDTAGGDGWGFVCFSVGVLFAASANTLVVFRAVRWSYRCPQCRSRLPRVPELEAGSRLLYLCAVCNVAWDTGWHKAEMG